MYTLYKCACQKNLVVLYSLSLSLSPPLSLPPPLSLYLSLSLSLSLSLPLSLSYTHTTIHTYTHVHTSTHRVDLREFTESKPVQTTPEMAAVASSSGSTCSSSNSNAVSGSSSNSITGSMDEAYGVHDIRSIDTINFSSRLRCPSPWNVAIRSAGKNFLLACAALDTDGGGGSK